jgi:hypothetical protein
LLDAQDRCKIRTVGQRLTEQHAQSPFQLVTVGNVVKQVEFGAMNEIGIKMRVRNSEVFSTLNPMIAARCLVGSVIEALRCWLEESPTDRMSAVEAARAVVDFNSRSLLR